jgi:hypothetical protein
MTRLTSFALLPVLLGFLTAPSRAADKTDPAVVIDKAVDAAGGRDKLAAVKAIAWSSKGTIAISGTDSPFTSHVVYQGPDKRRLSFEADIAGNPIKVVVVVNGDKGWRQVNGETEELSGDELARERRTGYLEWSTITLLPLKQPPFKIESAAETRVNDRPAAGVKVTGPDGQSHTLYFDNQTGLPVRLVATLTDFAGEATHESTCSDHTDFQGVKKAKKISIKRDGQKFIESELTEFKVTDAPEASTFAKPE